MSTIRKEFYTIRCDIRSSNCCHNATTYPVEGESSARYYAKDIGWVYLKVTKQDVCPACQATK